MKISLTCIFLFVCLISCKNEHQLALAPVTISGNDCAACPKVSIKIPEVLQNSKVAENINNSISEEIIAMLLFEEKEDIETATIAQAIESFNHGYTEMTELYDDEAAENWEAKITGRVTFENKNTLTIALDSYLFTGGAHGYSSGRFLNFDKTKGNELEVWQLFKNKEDFTQFAEAKFREQENIPEEKSINYTGFMFERDSFHLPENIGLTKNGIQLLYNQYEVAPFADGPIELILPYDESAKYLRGKLKSESLISSTTFEDSE